MSNADRGFSWKEPYEIRDLTLRTDPRGSLFEILRFADETIPPGGQLYTFSIEPGKRRGDHFHLRKKEWFTCVYGEAVLILLSAVGQRTQVVLSSDHPKIVYSAPGTCHALLNRTSTPAVIVSYGSKQHDPSDTDTFPKSAGD